MQKTVAPIRAFMQAFPLIRKFVTAIGIGLTLASLHPLKISYSPFGIHVAPPFDILTMAPGKSYSSSSTATYLLIALVVVCTALLVANVMGGSDRYLASVSGIGVILLGFFLLIPVAIGSGHLGDLSLAPKLALAGSALIVLGAVPLRSLGCFRRSRERNGLLSYVTWLPLAAGLGLVVFSLWQHIAIANLTATGAGGHPPRYWESAGFSGGHTLGIFMLALAVLGIAMAVGDAIFKIPLLGKWALTASLLLLGVTLYYPAGFAFNRLAVLSTGGWLALEGSLLASAGALIAVAVERGAVDLRASTVPKLVAIAGIGLALAGTWADIFGVRGSFWIDGTLAGLPSLLIVLAALLVAASFAYRSRWFLFSVSAIGWILAGYFGYYIAQTASDLHTLGPAMWLGVSGGALMGLSTVSMRALSDWRRRSASLTLGRLAPWLATAIGTGLVLVSLWLDTERAVASQGKLIHTSYWSFPTPNASGHLVMQHSLGIVMLVIGALVLVALVGAAVTRLRILSAWTLVGSLALLGIALFLPAFEAFHHFGELRSGAWLALAGALLASAGAVRTAILEKLPEEAEAEDTGVRSSTGAPVRTRKAAKGRVPGTRAHK